MKKIILILIFIALIFVANLSMTYPALYGVNTVAILVALKPYSGKNICVYLLNGQS